MTTIKILPPDPSRLIEGLRDTGYDFNTALADIIDNSVDAKATKVRIWIRVDPDNDIVVSVADDGHGMDETALLNAMTYGAKSKKDKSSLGKFGLGLKTASTAFARRLSVITRASATSPVLKATWDLDHVDKKKEWEILIDAPARDEIKLLDEAAGGGSGTLVLWEKVDRLTKEYVPNLASGVTVQGMDSLLWALAEAELGATTDNTRKNFKELRFEIARLLRNLVDDLPEPDMSGEKENA